MAESYIFLPPSLTSALSPLPLPSLPSLPPSSMLPTLFTSHHRHLLRFPSNREKRKKDQEHGKQMLCQAFGGALTHHFADNCVHRFSIFCSSGVRHTWLPDRPPGPSNKGRGGPARHSLPKLTLTMSVIQWTERGTPQTPINKAPFWLHPENLFMVSPTSSPRKIVS